MNIFQYVMLCLLAAHVVCFMLGCLDFFVFLGLDDVTYKLFKISCSIYVVTWIIYGLYIVKPVGL